MVGDPGYKLDQVLKYIHKQIQMENEQQERQEYDVKYVIFLDCHD